MSNTSQNTLTVENNVATKPRVLCVDDEPLNLILLESILSPCGYDVVSAANGAEALKIIQTERIDICLLDVMMPGMDGHEVCRLLKSDLQTKHIPIIFLTAQNSIEAEEHGLLIGAVDFIRKPISYPIVLARIRTHLQVKYWQDSLQNQNVWLQGEVERRLSEVNRLQESSIMVMVSLAEFRDECTGNHIRRTQKYVGILAERLARLPKYADLLTPQYIELLIKSAPLHDIGKISIPDNILLKPDKLTMQEFEIMKTHPLRGYEMLRTAGGYMGEQGDFLVMAMDMARSHHEKWDGTGYPDSLLGEQTPLPARLMAVADVFDALMTNRPYKTPMTCEQAYEIVVESSGSHFDPHIVEVFMNVQDEYQDIASKWGDH